MIRPATLLALGLAVLAVLCIPHDIARTLACFAALIVVFRWVYDGLERAGETVEGINEP